MECLIENRQGSYALAVSSFLRSDSSPSLTDRALLGYNCCKERDGGRAKSAPETIEKSPVGGGLQGVRVYCLKAK